MSYLLTASGLSFIERSNTVSEFRLLLFANRAHRVESDISCKRGKDSLVVGRDSKKDKNEGAMDKAKGRAKEAAGSLTGDKDKKSEGRADQNKGTAKKKKGAAKDLIE